MSKCSRLAGLSFWVLILTIAGKAQTPEPVEFFESRIRPLLTNNCYACHTVSKLGGLRIDSRQGLLTGGKSGPAIVPGNPEQSLLIRAVRQEDPSLKMLLGGKLTDQQIADLAAWIKMGAPWTNSVQPTT